MKEPLRHLLRTARALRGQLERRQATVSEIQLPDFAWWRLAALSHTTLT